MPYEVSQYKKGQGVMLDALSRELEVLDKLMDLIERPEGGGFVIRGRRIWVEAETIRDSLRTDNSLIYNASDCRCGT